MHFEIKVVGSFDIDEAVFIQVGGQTPAVVFDIETVRAIRRGAALVERFAHLAKLVVTDGECLAGDGRHGRAAEIFDTRGIQCVRAGDRSAQAQEDGVVYLWSHKTRHADGVVV